MRHTPKEMESARLIRAAIAAAGGADAYIREDEITRGRPHVRPHLAVGLRVLEERGELLTHHATRPRVRLAPARQLDIDQEAPRG